MKSKTLKSVIALSSKQTTWAIMEGGLGINYASDFTGTVTHSDDNTPRCTGFKDAGQ